jgi:MFS family permease
MRASYDELLNSRRAWLIAWAAFTVGLVVFGGLYSFGVFLQPMMRELHVGHASASALFSVAGLVFYICGPLTGYLGDRFGPRPLVGAGAALMGAGFILTGFIEHLWVGYLTYGALVGLGAASAYIPALAIVGGWFSERRDAALGLAAAGTGCGTMVGPPVVSSLIEQVGWRQTMIVLGVVSWALLAGCGLVVKAIPLKAGGAPAAIRDAIRSGTFTRMYVSWVFATAALMVPFVFLPDYALERGISGPAASALISIIGGMSIVGRLGIGFATQRIGVVKLFKAAVLVMSASYVLWLAAGSYGWMAAFTGVLGLGYGIRIALVPSVMITFFGLKNFGALLGIFFTATGVAQMIGPPVAGFIMEASGGSMWSIVFCLVAGLLAVAVIIPLGRPPPTTSEAGQVTSLNVQ